MVVAIILMVIGIIAGSFMFYWTGTWFVLVPVVGLVILLYIIARDTVVGYLKERKK